MPGIFICYRRDDSGGYARHLYDRLTREFGRKHVFMDLDDIPVGDDFAVTIAERMRTCTVLLVLIGPNWLTAAKDTGHRRIDDPRDFVRLEIEAAFAQSLTVIPVLVGGARMPSADSLPGAVARLSYLNAFELYDKIFDASVKALLALVRKRLRALSWTHRATVMAHRLREVVVSVPRERRVVLMLAGAPLLLYLLVMMRPANVNEQPSTRVEQPSSPPPAQSAGAVAVETPALELKAPVRVSAPPAVVPEARYIADKDRSLAGAAGPRRPRVLWQAAFPSLGTFAGLAGDGTLYFEAGDVLDTRALYAIRNGVQVWGYSFSLPASVSRVLFAADGLVWVEQQYDSVDRPGDSRWFAFNSRGQGGLTPAKSFPNLAPQSRIVVRGWGAGGIDGWSLRQVQFEYKNCEPGELSGIHTTERSENVRWKLAIDGSCVAQDVNDHGELIVATDTAMLYGVDPRGRMRWSHKAACRTDWIVAVGRDNAAYLCGRDLHRTGADGKRWNLTLDGHVDRGTVKVDAAESLYLLTQDGNLLLAIDKSGKLLWRHPVAAGQILGLDKAGRLYVRSGGTLACLSD